MIIFNENKKNNNWNDVVNSINEQLVFIPETISWKIMI